MMPDWPQTQALLLDPARHQARPVEGPAEHAARTAFLPSVASRNQTERSLVGADVVQIENALEDADAGGVDVQALRGRSTALRQELRGAALELRLAQQNADRLELGPAPAEIASGQRIGADLVQHRLDHRPLIGMGRGGDGLHAVLEMDGFAGRPHGLDLCLDASQDGFAGATNGTHQPGRQVKPEEPGARELFPGRVVMPVAVAKGPGFPGLDFLHFVNDRLQDGHRPRAQRFVRLEHPPVGRMKAVIDDRKSAPAVLHRRRSPVPLAGKSYNLRAARHKFNYAAQKPDRGHDATPSIPRSVKGGSEAAADFTK